MHVIQGEERLDAPPRRLRARAGEGGPPGADGAEPCECNDGSRHRESLPRCSLATQPAGRTGTAASGTRWRAAGGRAKGPLILAEGDGAWVTDVDGTLPRRAERPVVRQRRLRPQAAGRRRPPSSSSGSRSTRSRAATCRDRARRAARRRCSAAAAPRSTRTPARRRTSSRSSSCASTTSCAASPSASRSSPATAPTTARRSARSSATGQACAASATSRSRPASCTSPPPDPYRDGIAADDLDAYGRRCAAELERTIQFELPETVAAVIMEPIITGGGDPDPARLLPARREGDAAERHGVLLIVDEVICGFGRTGTWFGHEAAGRPPGHRHDGEGHHRRVLPARGDGRRRGDLRRLPGRPGRHGRLRHINTFGGHPAGCAVALETLAIMEEEELVERSAGSARRCWGACARRSATTRWSATSAAAGC